MIVLLMALEKSYKNMLSVKSLTKKAYFGQKGVIISTHTLYGKEWDYWPIQHFVFAYDSTGLDSVLDNLNTLQNTDEIHKRISYHTHSANEKGKIYIKYLRTNNMNN